MSEAYYIAKEGKAEGPFPKTELKQLLKQGKLGYTDYLWLNDAAEWVMLANFFQPEFPVPKDPPPGITVKKQKKVTPPPVREVTGKVEMDFGISNEPIWFLYHNNAKFGPYRYLEIVKLLQSKECTAEDFVWKPSFQDWQRIRTVTDFSKDILRKLSHVKSADMETVFIKRRFPRVPYDGEVILHDNHRVVFGSAKSISEGGVFVELEKATHTKGDRLKIHFTPGGVELPFNCIAEITQVMKGNPAGYCLKFIYLEEDDRKRIASFAAKRATAEL